VKFVLCGFELSSKNCLQFCKLHVFSGTSNHISVSKVLQYYAFSHKLSSALMITALNAGARSRRLSRVGGVDERRKEATRVSNIVRPCNSVIRISSSTDSAAQR
jgi:hypothetical protein